MLANIKDLGVFKMIDVYPLARIDEPTQFVSLSTIRQSWDLGAVRSGVRGAWLPMKISAASTCLPFD